MGWNRMLFQRRGEILVRIKGIRKNKNVQASWIITDCKKSVPRMSLIVRGILSLY